MKKQLLAMTAVFSLTLNSFACVDGRSGIVPNNNMRIPVGTKTLGGITEKEFNDVITKIETIYAPIVKAKGGNLKVFRKWTDATVNAYAQRSGSTYEVHMFGGLARHQAVTADGFALVVCHELGHHIGGIPTKGGSWASNEGQADYFATLKCLRRVFEGDDNVGLMTQRFISRKGRPYMRWQALPEIVQAKCKDNFTHPEDEAICGRNAMAGLSLASLFQDLSGSAAPKFETPDTRVVAKTDHNHPKSQCRLDTYFAGSICRQDHRIDVSYTDAKVGSCTQELNEPGFRPRCWYANSTTPSQKPPREGW